MKTLEGRCISQKQLTIIGTIQGRGMGALQQADLRRGLLTWYYSLRRRARSGGGRAAHPALRCCRLLGLVTFTVQDFTSSHRTSNANQVGMSTGIEPTSSAFQADVVTTAPQHPIDDNTKIAPSHSTMDSHSGSKVEGGFEVKLAYSSVSTTLLCVWVDQGKA